MKITFYSNLPCMFQELFTFTVSVFLRSPDFPIPVKFAMLH